MIPIFGRSVTEPCNIASVINTHIFETHGHLFTILNQLWLSTHWLKEFPDAVHHKDASLSNCWDFTGGPVRPICSQGQNQKYFYNELNKIHATNLQSITTPNNLIANLHGPIGGKRHDSAMLAESRLLDQMQLHCNDANGYFFCIWRRSLTFAFHIFKNIFRVPELMISRNNLIL